MTAQQASLQQVSRRVALIQAGALALVMATICGAGLFLLTAWLLLKGGKTVGPHLSLLGQYLVGYSVTWAGSVVGLFYGALLGGVIGWSIGFIYNRVAAWRRQ